MKLINYILAIIPVVSFLGCEDDLKPYDEKTDRLNFVYENTRADTIIHRTFFYDLESRVFDTVMLEVKTMGFVVNENRTFALKQVVKDGDNTSQAEAGVHYVDFSDPLVKDLYIVPAGQNKVSIPVILKRDASMVKQAFTLRVRIASNENFEPGYADMQEKIITVTDTLAKPKLWNMYIVRYWGGEYGFEKHKFMIRATANMGIKIDDNFLRPMAQSKVDFSMTAYWYEFFSKKLEEENAERAARGLGPLREAPGEGEVEGRLVKFVKY